MHGLTVYVKEGLPFAWDLSLEHSAHSYVFNWLYFTQSYFFSSIDHLLHLCAQFLILFHLTDEVLLINPSANIFVKRDFIIRTDLPILVKLTNLVNSIIIFLSQVTLLRWLTFLLGCQAVILIVLLFWMYFLLLMLVFVLQWPSRHLEILIMLLSQFPLTFHQIPNWISPFTVQLMAILVLVGTVFVIIREMFQGRISLNLVLLPVLVNFVSGFWLELIYISLIENIRSSLTHLCGFQLLLLLP